MNVAGLSPYTEIRPLGLRKLPFGITNHLRCCELTVALGTDKASTEEIGAALSGKVPFRFVSLSPNSAERRTYRAFGLVLQLSVLRANPARFTRLSRNVWEGRNEPCHLHLSTTASQNMDMLA